MTREQRVVYYSNIHVLTGTQSLANH